jgi:predicted AAA+ superfamily ATPase
MLIREQYLNILESFKDNQSIKIITGVRRCGKSTVLLQFIDVLKNKHKVIDKQIIYYDFNNLDLKRINYYELHKQILNKCVNNKINYVFLDEIQEIKKFEECVNSLHANKKIKFDIYLTGSNSHMFSRNLSTLFTGRNIEIKMYPLSFKEYFDYVSLVYKNDNRRQVFEKFLKYGGLPLYIDFFNDKKNIEAKLNGVIEDTQKRDILQRHRISNFSDFNRLFQFLFDHIGQEISTKNISNTIKSKNKNVISPKTVDRYID